MPATDPPEPPAPPDSPDAAAPDTAPAPARPGPGGITRRDVADAIDTWMSRTGAAPSLRQLRTALGDRGSMTTLTRLRGEVLGKRLLQGTETLARGSPDAAILEALVAARSALAAEAAAAADDAIAAGEAAAADRVRAADARAGRAERDAVDAALATERATGRAQALETGIAVLRDERRALEGDLAAAREREAVAERTSAALRAELGQLGTELERVREQARTEATTLTERLEAVEAERRWERTERTETERVHAEALAAEARRTSDLDRRLARAETRRDAALARVDDALARVDAAAHRADRSESERRRDARRNERALAELAAARREDLGRTHARIDQLAAALADAEARVPDPVVPLPSLEFQPGLFLDEAADGEGDSSLTTADADVPGRGAPPAPQKPD